MTFEEFILKANKEVGEYENGYLEDLMCYPEDAICIGEDKDYRDEHRWYVKKRIIHQFGDRYFAAEWDAPATERQEGQETYCKLYEVIPEKVEKTVWNRK